MAAIDRPQQRPNLKKTIHHILAHYEGKEPAVSGYIQGLASYNTWIQAIQEEKLDSIGHAYQVALMKEAREHALCFLQDIHNFESEKEVRSAVASFQQVDHFYGELYPRFPYGFKDIQLNVRDHAVPLLKQIQQAEAQGTHHLKKFLKKSF
ncbi:hypothetical protein [Salinibacillus xinjiangensis]|uniref:Uncharacterized protein n=1 Tax=Salinibacillus xinjiangensis TaxID=1229268 RepID=A0A6G1XAA8_9BACI|nr:hypothetical protein [Salinibacillus xinjiangensis]MRG87836.1 hypothetical protein [Salinibacillus xinjiangensis]